MAAKNGTTLPIRKPEKHLADLAATHLGETQVDYTTKVIGAHARKTLTRLGVPFVEPATEDSKS